MGKSGAKALVVVGTSSGAGKSLIVSALCRIAVNSGIKVCPFKAQNMSLQSYVTRDGGEIGLAQALQAFASKLEPRREFNPILLKATGKGSQVMLMGKVYGTLSPKEYYEKKGFFWEKVRSALEVLKEEYELIVVEGAGSPAEINLLDSDIVNLRIASELKAPAILVADIDKGGVFASIYGTEKLLKIFAPSQHKALKGFVINKFRGDPDILQPGITAIEDLTGLKCYGIIPFFEDLKIAEEDGAGLPLRRYYFKENLFEKVKVVVLRLKFIANFWDFDPLVLEPDVELVYSLRHEDILNADAVIIPGSKNTVADLKFLRKLGLDEVLKQAVKKGVELVGICGGFQMLGEVIRDPDCVESEEKEVKALGLLEAETIFVGEKVTTQVLAETDQLGSYENLWGYEIHMGRTYGDLFLFKAKRLATGEEVIDGSKKKSVWGTYFHGIFTNDDFRRGFLNRLREKKGLKPASTQINYFKELESTIDALARQVKKFVDVKELWSLVFN